MKLYGFPASPNTWKVRAVAAHLGLPLESAFVDLTKGEQRKPEFIALNPTGRMATPEEIGRGIVFLASPASSFTSGTNLVIDGALTKGVQL